MYHKKNDDDDDDGSEPVFSGIDRATVVQETRTFNNPTIKPRQAAAILTSLLYVLAQGEQLSEEEATSVFFNCTKLWQSSDVLVRRLVYLVIKELSTATEDAIMITASLTKDINSSNELFRSHAIRALCRICEPSMLGQLERYIKAAIVDKNPQNATAALVAGYKLLPAAPDLVRRWGSEVSEVATSGGRSPLVQYHATGLLYGMRRGDKLAVAKMVSQFSTTRSMWAQMLLVRAAANVLREGVSPETAKPLMSFLTSCVDTLRADMVLLEAARAVCTLPGFQQRDIQQAVESLQTLLQSGRPVLRFAAVRTLSDVASTHPALVAAVNSDLESLAGDANRSIATLAITTLLKTGRETSVDRLLKQITTFLTDVPDEFKVVVVEGVRQLALKFRDRHRAVLALLGSCLHQDGGFMFKRAIVDAIVSIVAEIPESREFALVSLCDFIEDCEFMPLLVRVLNVLGNEAPKTPQPGKYLRHIANRIILENATVRAAAVVTLAKFARQCEAVREPVIRLLERCMQDSDDEVRDRATMYYLALTSPAAEALLTPDLGVPLENLERSLRQYLAQPTDTPFDLATVPAAPEPSHAPRTGAAAGASALPAGVSAASPAMPTAASGAAAAVPASAAGAGFTVSESVLAVLPSELGPVQNARGPTALTERQIEIQVEVTRVVFAAHVALVFGITNTLDDMSLVNTAVTLVSRETPARRLQTAPLPPIGPHSSAHAAVVLPRPEPVLQEAFGATLTFVVSEDGSADGAEEELALEDVELGLPDFIVPRAVPDFEARWAATGGESVQTYQLASMATVDDAVTAVCDYLGLVGPASVPKGARTFTTTLSGEFAGSGVLLARAQFALVPGQGVALELAVRADDPDIAAMVASAIG